MRPSVGRIVHYVSYGTPGGEYSSMCRAAIVTEIQDDNDDAEVIGVAVLNPTGMFFNQAPHDESEVKDGGTWHWPEKVED